MYGSSVDIYPFYYPSMLLKVGTWVLAAAASKYTAAASRYTAANFAGHAAPSVGVDLFGHVSLTSTWHFILILQYLVEVMLSIKKYS